MHACMHVYTFGLRISIGLNSEQIFHFSEVERVKKEGNGGGIEGGWEENREKKKKRKRKDRELTPPSIVSVFLRKDSR